MQVRVVLAAGLLEVREVLRMRPCCRASLSLKVRPRGRVLRVLRRHCHRRRSLLLAVVDPCTGWLAWHVVLRGLWRVPCCLSMLEGFLCVVVSEASLQQLRTGWSVVHLLARYLCVMPCCLSSLEVNLFVAGSETSLQKLRTGWSLMHLLVRAFWVMPCRLSVRVVELRHRGIVAVGGIR